ncbi:hypothetical protein PUN28_003181 [Cardiocondyla obscurior]|uniref:Uncharacterized protein n=1 Tax=Cardiocondyla obscurior TaxID=286306 RepID=A0AAW2GHR4_9HYME
MHDECRPFPSNGNATAVGNRGCVPPPSRSDGNPRKKKKKKKKRGGKKRLKKNETRSTVLLRHCTRGSK